MGENPQERQLEIKKYANRRYYDATHSRHLTLEEIRALVQEGFDLHVTEAKTGQDITAQVLTQIILELDTPKLGSLPVPLLVSLIRMNDTLIKDFIDKYFNQALQSFLVYQRGFENQLRKVQGMPGVLPSVSAWAQAVMKPFSSALDTAPEPPQPPNSDSSQEDLRTMVMELSREVAQLKGASKKKRKGR